TMSFCDHAGIDKQVIRDNYRGEYYSTYQFYRANRFYAEVLPDEYYYAACDYAADTAHMNTDLIADICLGLSSYTTFAVTSGILDIWERIQMVQNFPNIVVGKGRANDGGVYVSTFVKQAIVEELKALNKKILAIGDSPIDIGMLETADQGYIVAMPKLSTGMVTYFAKASRSQIRQLTYSTYKYENVEEVRSIWQSLI
ncbi:MAG: HAD hydrolase family protein, partial [Peptococcaceae bacterium]|nr:HAD hydrolase family protein [Peptococcaceae bacterium]